MARKFRYPVDAANIVQAIARVAEQEGASDRIKAVIRLLGRMIGDRDRALEDFINGGGVGAGVGTIPIFTYPGPLASGIESPPFYPPVPITLTQIRVSLLANATTNHTIEVHVNGALITGGSVTLTTGNKTVTATIALSVALTDYITVVAVTVADANLAVELS